MIVICEDADQKVGYSSPPLIENIFVLVERRNVHEVIAAAKQNIDFVCP
jgi:hypothetical protein